jgi:hypothetical protein
VYYRRAAFRCEFLWAKGLSAKIFMKKYYLFAVGSVCRVKFTFGGKHFADDEEAETEVLKWLRKLLCCGFRRTGKAMGQVYQCSWRICREISVFFFSFEYHMFYVLYPFVTYLLTPSYIRSSGRYLKPEPPECEAGASITRPWCLSLSLRRRKSMTIKSFILFYTKFRIKRNAGA